jgi:hypothetical protein
MSGPQGASIRKGVSFDTSLPGADPVIRSSSGGPPAARYYCVQSCNVLCLQLHVAFCACCTLRVHNCYHTNTIRYSTVPCCLQLPQCSDVRKVLTLPFTDLSRCYTIVLQPWTRGVPAVCGLPAPAQAQGRRRRGEATLLTREERFCEGSSRVLPGKAYTSVCTEVLCVASSATLRVARTCACHEFAHGPCDYCSALFSVFSVLNRRLYKPYRILSCDVSRWPTRWRPYRARPLRAFYAVERTPWTSHRAGSTP